MDKICINRNFGLLICGKFVSEIGDKFYAIALAFWVLQTTGSPSLMGIVLFSSMVPAIVLGFFIGVVIDKYDRKTILIIADILRGLIIAVVMVIYYMDLLNLTIIMIAQILLSICSAFFDPSMQAVIPQVVEGEQLAKANSLSSLVGGVAMVIGPVLGGLSVQYMGYTFVFIFNSLSFIVSALFKILVRLPRIRDKVVHMNSYKENIRDGYQYIFSKKRLIVLIAVISIVHFFVGSVQVILPVLATKLSGNGARNLGYLQTFFGLGVVVTALLLSIIKHKKHEEHMVFLGIGGIGLVFVACGAILWFGKGGIFPFLVIFMLLSSAIIVISTNYQTILQKNITQDMSGRVFSVTNSLGDSSIPIAMLVMGILLDYFPWHLVIIFYGITIVLIGIKLFRTYKPS